MRLLIKQVMKTHKNTEPAVVNSEPDGNCLNLNANFMMGVQVSSSATHCMKMYKIEELKK